MKKFIVAAAGLVLFGLIMLLLRPERDAVPVSVPEKAAPTLRESSAPKPRANFTETFIEEEKALETAPALPPFPKGALRGEMTLTYPDAESAEAARQRLLAAGFDILGYNRALNTLRVRVRGADDRQALARLAGPDAKPGYNFPVASPTPPTGTKAVGGSQPFGADAVKWMGGTGEASVGKGVKVAVVDTGDTGHGASVASLVSGLSTGIAPGAEVLSISSLGENGQGDAFTVAEGIVSAVDAGARIINLSLGTYGNAAVLQAAVDYAQANGAIVVAAVGNDAAGQVTYPAAYNGVVGVASVDAAGQTATFSNYGKGVDIAAPGVEVQAAIPMPEAFADDLRNIATTYGPNVGIGAEAYTSFSGTSASTPLVSGALAALLSENPSMSNEQAVEILLSTANDSGAPGEDDYLGAGSANLERMLEYSQTGVSDVAIADHYLASGDSEAVSVLVSVQNRGTEWSGDLTLEIAYEGRQQSYLIGGLNPGETMAQEILLNPTLLTNGGSTLVQSRVTSSSEDVRPDDNSRATRISLQVKESSE